MAEQPETVALAARRIVVAVDASEGAAAALESAVLLADLLRAELEAVFVEDRNLVRLARLPFAREWLAASATQRTLDPFAMEQALRVQGERLRRRLEARLGPVGLRWRFSVLRGDVPGTLLGRVAAADLLVLGRAGVAPGRAEGSLGSTARAVLAAARCTVLLAPAGALPAHPVVVLFDGSPPAQRALDMGVELARRDRDGLVVLVPEPDGGEIEAQVRQRLADSGVAARLRRIPGAAPELLARAVRSAGGRVFVAGAGPAEDLERICAALPCPVLLVR